MAKSKIGFHTGPGGKKQGLGDWERKLNEARQPFGMKAVDEYGPIKESLDTGRQNGVQNWLGFRYTRASGKVSREVPEYDADPKIDAPRLCQEVIDRLPPEFDKAVWLEIINEPRAQNKGDDTMFAGMNACDYLGEWCLAAARFLNNRGYKFMGPSFNSGEPGREGLPIADAVTQYSQPGMLKYLAYCAGNPEKAALSVHEYSWSNWKDGQTAADWYPALWGRFEAAIAAADLNGIPRTFPIFVSEFGFAHQEAPSGQGAHPYLDARNQMTARWPQLKYDASWTLQQGWGSVDANVNTWLEYEAGKEFGEGQQPAATHASFGGTLPGAPEEGEGGKGEESEEIESPAGPGATFAELFRLVYTGFGVKDVGEEKGAWYDVGNVQVPIIDGQRMTYWQAKGDNPFGDGQPWNNFGPPEGVFRWDAYLPEDEHFLLNDERRCYHLFAPASAWWARFWVTVHLEPGAYRLSLDLWGDWVDIVDGQKVPKPDPGHARVELFLGEEGKETWLHPQYADRSTLQKAFTIEEPGEYAAGFGVLTVFAPGDKPGANGCFLRSFTLEQLDTTVATVSPTGRVLGMDISYAQGQSVDFKKAAEAGVKFVFIRAGSGKTTQDANFERNYMEASQAGMLRGIYYYLYPESKATVGMAEDRTPEGQARRFAALLKAGAELGAALDVEEHGLAAGEVKRFVDEFQKHDPYGRPITIYTRASFWNDALGASVEDLAWAAGHPLWVAHFASGTEPIIPDDDFQVAVPKPWQEYVVHQWTSVGGSLVGQAEGKLDLDYFLGSEADLRAWVRDVGVLQAAAFESTDTKVVTSGIGLWLRKGPSMDFDKIRLMEPGAIVEVIEEGAWAFVRLDGDVGYASSEYLKSETESEVPVEPGAYHYHGPAVEFYTGLHGPADDAAWNRPGFKDKIKELKLPLVFMSNGINPDFAGMGDPARNVVRLYWNPEKVTADKAYEAIRDDQLKRWWEKGARRFIFFNEPQLTKEDGQSNEGMKIAWNSAGEFANYLKTCLSRAREEFPGIYLYTTPVTSNVAFDPWGWRNAIWAHNWDVVDGWCMHAYSANNSDASAAVKEILDQVKKLQRHFRLQIPIIVSEASVNRGDDAEQKAKVALLLAEKAAAIPGLEAVFWFAADWDPGFDVNNEGWFRKGIADAYIRLRDG